MCGIFGVVSGKKNIVPILIEGIRKMEYRGYDSWGVAVITEGGKLVVHKKTDRIPDFNEGGIKI